MIKLNMELTTSDLSGVTDRRLHPLSPLSLSDYSSYFRRRQEVAAASLPAPYRAASGCFSQEALNPNRSPESQTNRTISDHHGPLGRLRSDGRDAHLPSWLRSTASNCFLNHLQGKRKMTVARSTHILLSSLI